MKFYTNMSQDLKPFYQDELNKADVAFKKKTLPAKLEAL